jgi:hypothetical protein
MNAPRLGLTALLPALLLLAACSTVPKEDPRQARGGSDDDEGTDTASTDSGVTDTGSGDTGTADTGADSGTGDSGDTGSTDPVSPYTGGWTVGACADSIRATGNRVGQVSQDFALLDQYGDTVYLHDFCDRVVWLVFAAFW